MEYKNKLLISVILLFSLFGCGGSDEKNEIIGPEYAFIVYYDGTGQNDDEYDGIVITTNGDVSYFSGLIDESSYILSGYWAPERSPQYSNDEILAVIQEGRVNIDTVNTEILDRYINLADKLNHDNLVSTNTRSDSGTIQVLYLNYDVNLKLYQPILIEAVGGVYVENLSPEAPELVSWLQQYIIEQNVGKGLYIQTHPDF